ncbi:hypothetical protein GH714_034912 [Hevea brasiliensis]|uniref:non-specific serine/threonine protein kinase n=1 Tax=Hevea brasiliensis TaxID=3981 RepID=A0A6A6MKG8_HEVBR|nr:hypothetical protein GH714_034912 [Hevea brasiliensis]
MSCSSSSGSESEDDEGIDSYRKGGYHAVRVGDQFAGGRYIAQGKLGWGQFSTVWLAYDTQSSKSASQFAQAALHEIEVLSSIANGDPSNSKCVVRLIDHFKHAGPNGHHHCMVLEFLGDSLLRLIRHSRYKGLELNKVREICKCILIGLDYLHRELCLIHNDLKPENILLYSTIDPAKDPIRSGLTPILQRPEGSLNGGSTMNIIEKKLKRRAKRAVAKISERRASMGGATEKPKKCLDGVDVRCKVVDLEMHAGLISSLQKKFKRGSIELLKSFCGLDIPSLLICGHLLALLLSLLQDHLALMMELLGKMPRKIAVGGARSKDFFDRYGDLKRIRRLKFWPLDRLLVDKYKFSENEAREFAEFLCPLLDFIPEKRPTAQQCLQHPWLNLRTSAQIEMKKGDIEKLHVGMSNLQLKVGK